MVEIAVNQLSLAEREEDRLPSAGPQGQDDWVSDTASAAEEVASGAKKSKNKRKKKRKPKAKAGNPLLNSFPEETSPPSPELPELKAKRDEELLRHTTRITPNAMLLLEYPKADLDRLWTPSCRSLELLTPRLRLRQCELGDLKMIQKIKTEPTVNKTQLYGQPHLSWIKPSFLGRYIRASMPQIEVKEENGWRVDYVFAITLRDPSSVEVGSPGRVMLRNRLLESDKAGYVGNFGLELKINKPSQDEARRKGVATTHPTFADMDKAGVTGSMYYELHPQLWGKGLVSEAFVEVLRFAAEEVGCPIVIADPTKGNEASIKLCEKNGLKFKRTTTDNPYNKPQLIHEITRDEWFTLNRRSKPMDQWGGKPVCRWCMNPRLAPPTIVCQYCDWARYCSRECQKADWVYGHGHQEQCAGRAS